MNISLPPEQQKWLEAQVAAGQFSSIDEALAVAVAELKALHDSDFAWAKPYVDQARAEVVRGNMISAQDFFAVLDRFKEPFMPERREQPDDQERDPID